MFLRCDEMFVQNDKWKSHRNARVTRAPIRIGGFTMNWSNVAGCPCQAHFIPAFCREHKVVKKCSSLALFAAAVMERFNIGSVDIGENWREENFHSTFDST